MVFSNFEGKSGFCSQFSGKMIKKVIPGKNLSKLRISTVIYVTYSFIACYRACMHIRYVRFVHQPSGAGPRLSIWLAAPRGAADVYVSLCMFWSYLTTFARGDL